MGILARKSAGMPMRAHNPLPLAELACVLALRTLNFSRHNAGRNCPDDAVSNLVLHNENIVECAVVTVRPDMVTGGGVDQLCSDTHATAGLTQAAFEHIAHAELAADLPHVNRFALVGE